MLNLYVKTGKKSVDKTKDFFGEKYTLKHILQRNTTDFSPDDYLKSKSRT